MIKFNVGINIHTLKAISNGKLRSKGENNKLFTPTNIINTSAVTRDNFRF